LSDAKKPVDPVVEPDTVDEDVTNSANEYTTNLMSDAKDA